MIMLLVSLAHQFIWLSFALVFTRNVSLEYSQIWLYIKLSLSFCKKLGLNEVDYDYIFIMSDRATFRDTYRPEP